MLGQKILDIFQEVQVGYSPMTGTIVLVVEEIKEGEKDA